MGGAARGLIRACAALALAVALALADAGAAAGCPDVKSLLRATQTQASVSMVTQVVRQVIAMTDDAGKLSTAEMERLYEAGIDAYSPIELTSDIRASLESHCNAEAVASALAFYRSTSGVKLIRGSLELARESDGASEQAYFDKLLEEGLSNGRLEAVRSVRPASLAFEVPPRVRLALIRPLAVVAIRAVATEQGLPAPSEAEIAEGIARDSAAQNAWFDMHSDLSLLFATRDLSAAELQEVRSFLGSSAGVWYRESMARAFEGAVAKAGARFTAAANP
jgi:hypothetical protein